MGAFTEGHRLQSKGLKGQAADRAPREEGKAVSRTQAPRASLSFMERNQVG